MTEPVKWEFHAPNAFVWSEKAYDMMTADPPTLRAELGRNHGVLACVVDGLCPRCQDPIPQTVVLSAVTQKVSDFNVQAPIRGSGDEPVEVVVSCTCSEAHEGRPQDTTEGCGINFKLLLREEGR